MRDRDTYLFDGSPELMVCVSGNILSEEPLAGISNHADGGSDADNCCQRVYNNPLPVDA